MDAPSFCDGFDTHHNGTLRCRREGHPRHQQSRKSCKEISDFLYLDDDTIRGWHKAFLRDGWDALAYDCWKGGQSRMTQATGGCVCAWLEARFYRSTVEIRAHLTGEYRLTYSHSGCIKLLARLGFEYRKPKPLPRVVSNSTITDVFDGRPGYTASAV